MGKENLPEKAKFFCPVCFVALSARALHEHIAENHLQHRCLQIAYCPRKECKRKRHIFSVSYLTEHMFHSTCKLIFPQKDCSHRVHCQILLDKLMNTSLQELGPVTNEGLSIYDDPRQQDRIKKHRQRSTESQYQQYAHGSKRPACFVKDHQDNHNANGNSNRGFGRGSAFDNIGRSPGFCGGSRSPGYGGGGVRSPGYGGGGGRSPGYGGDRSPGYGEGGRSPGYVGGGDRSPGYGGGGDRSPGYGGGGDRSPGYGGGGGRSPGYGGDRSPGYGGGRSPGYGGGGGRSPGYGGDRSPGHGEGERIAGYGRNPSDRCRSPGYNDQDRRNFREQYPRPNTSQPHGNEASRLAGTSSIISRSTSQNSPKEGSGFTIKNETTESMKDNRVSSAAEISLTNHSRQNMDSNQSALLTGMAPVAPPPPHRSSRNSHNFPSAPNPPYSMKPSTGRRNSTSSSAFSRSQNTAPNPVPTPTFNGYNPPGVSGSNSSGQAEPSFQNHRNQIPWHTGSSYSGYNNGGSNSALTPFPPRDSMDSLDKLLRHPRDSDSPVAKKPRPKDEPSRRH